MIQKAIYFAAMKHDGQYRRNRPVPYIVHPMDVMYILTKNGSSQDTIVAGILHDTIEDTNTTLEEIRRHFGDTIAEMVSSETEDKTKTWDERKQFQIDLLATESLEHHEICCADKLSNLKDLYHDLNDNGEVVWNKFRAPKEKICWYYGEIIKHLDLVKDTRMYKELCKYYKLVFGIEIK